MFKVSWDWLVKMEKSLLVFGAGNLGEKVAFLWKQKNPEQTVYAVTNTTNKHSLLASKNVLPFRYTDKLPKASHVIFCVPPTEDYSLLVKTAMESWDRSGNFLFISSASIYQESNSGVVTEESNINPHHRLFSIEQQVLQGNGLILRLAGLYDQNRGPHICLKKNMKFSTSENSMINLIHSMDAANLSVKALEDGEVGAIYLGCDGCPLTKKEFSKIVLELSADRVEYLSNNDLGKKCNNDWTRNALSWAPRWSDFREWAQKHL